MEKIKNKRMFMLPEELYYLLRDMVGSENRITVDDYVREHFIVGNFALVKSEKWDDD